MRRQNGNVDPSLLELMKSGAYFYKHDFGRSKRSRKWLVLSTDGLSLRWRGVGQQEVVAVGDGSGTSRGGSSARGLLRSSSFSRFTTISMADVSHNRDGWRLHRGLLRCRLARRRGGRRPSALE